MQNKAWFRVSGIARTEKFWALLEHIAQGEDNVWGLCGKTFSRIILGPGKALIVSLRQEHRKKDATLAFSHGQEKF